MMTRRSSDQRLGRIVLSLTAAVALGVAVQSAQAQLGSTGLPATTLEAMQRTARQLSRPITVELTDARLEDIIQFASDFSGAQLEPLWLDDQSSEGLDKDLELSISVHNVRVIEFIERVLEKASSDFSAATWQFSKDGRSIEIGPRSRLNAKHYLKAYDINDLLFELPDFDDFPELDLDQVLNQGQRGGSGGSSGSIFEDDDQEDLESKTPQQLAEDLIDLLTEFVETDQWRDNGGDGANVRFYNGYLLIDAPNYIHRQLGGLPFDFTSAPAGSDSN